MSTDAPIPGATPAPNDPSGKTAAPTGQPATPAPNPAPAPPNPAPPVDNLVTRNHSLRIGRRTLRYTSTTGRLVLAEEVTEDKVFRGQQPKAQVSITAYTMQHAGSAAAAEAARRARPITFAFNGGPGSSSVWLHLGLLGPRRVEMGDAGALAPPPYALADNLETLLATTDLVFIDPVSTGYSRAVEGGRAEPFHGYTGDIASVAEVIRLWTSRHGRWMSPKFLIGESYGTLRAAALAERLQTRYGMYLNGIMLISSVLEFSSIDFEIPRNDRAHALYLPFYAAVAHLHGKHGRRSLRSVTDEAEAYAGRDYPWVLSRGSRLTAAERSAAVTTIARLTGLTEDYVDRADLRIEHWRFFGELLRDRGLAVGRIDARFTGPLASRLAEEMDADPSMDAISGPYAAAWNHYVRAELGFESDLHYEQITDAVHPWSMKEFEGKPISVVDKLERAMRTNPHLRVHVAFGIYDGATPPYPAQDVLAHLNLPADLRANIETATYPAGHMMYVHEPSRRAQSTDLADFIGRAASAH